MSTFQRLPRALTLLACALFAANSASAAEAVSWRQNLDAARIEATQSHKLLLIHFYTHSCGPCRILDQDVFSQPHVSAGMEVNYVPVKVDADVSPAIASALRIDRVPTDVIMTPEGNVVAAFPATRTVAPARWTPFAFASPMPPSTWIGISTRAASSSIRRYALGLNGCPE